MSDVVSALPVHGEVFVDARGGDRTLRVSWHRPHTPDGVVVLSLWRDDTCIGSFRLRHRDVPLLVDLLARWDDQASAPTQYFPPATSFGPPKAGGAGNLSA